MFSRNTQKYSSTPFLSRKGVLLLTLIACNFAVAQESTDKGSVTETTVKTKSISSNINKHSFGLGLGQTFLVGNYGDHGDDKITFDALYSYSASHSFDLMVNAHYNQMSIGAQEIDLAGLTTGIKSRFFNFDSFAPFLVGGLGFYRPIAKRFVNGGLQESESKITFGLHAGAGADLQLNDKFSLGLMGLLHKPFRAKQDTQPALTGSYFKLLLTLMYTLP